MSLLSKNKLKFVDGTITMPDPNAPIYPLWEQCNTMVLSWLIRSLDPSITQSVIWMDKAYEVWQELRERFSQGDLFRIADLQDEIASLKQGDQSVTKYFTELKILWDELDVFRPTPTCRCAVQRDCGAFQEMKNQSNSDHAIRFLRGLSEQFSDVRSQIMLLDPLPSMNKIFSLVI